MRFAIRSFRGRLVATALLALAFVFASRPAHASGGIGDLFVTSDASNATFAYDGVSGAALGLFTNSVLGNGELGIHFGYGPSAGKVAIGHFSGGVDEFDLAGNYIKTYAQFPDWQWTGIYAPNGNIYIGSMATQDVREYDGNTGAFVRVLCPVPNGPADMAYAPNGHLFICQFFVGGVMEVDAISGAVISQWSLPAGEQANDVTFLPSPPRILVTAMGSNVVYVYNPAHFIVGIFSGANWGRPHGISISPHDGKIYVADGVSTQVSVHDPTTYVELNPAFCVPGTNTKIVDIDWRPDQPTPATPESWGGVKDRYRH